MAISAAMFLGVGLITLTASPGAEACAELTLVARGGEVSSPNFPEQYYPNTCTIWTMQKAYHTVVTISFSYLDLPQDTDDGNCYSNYVEVGVKEYKKTFCGRHSNSSTTFPYQYDKQFYIKFVSGSVPAGRGFRLEYFVGSWRYWNAERCPDGQFHCRSGKCIPDYWKCNGRTECEHGDDELCHGTPSKPTSLQTVTQKLTTPVSVWRRNVSASSCSHVLHNRTGQFKLLVSANAVYDTCSWLIDVPGKVDKIVLRFLRLDIYSDAYIWVYKGSMANTSNCVGMFDGKSKIQTVTAHSSSMFIEFRLAFDNPASVSRDLYFVAKYSAFSGENYLFNTPASTGESCYHQLDQRVGNFSMPRRAFQSSIIRSCTWHIYKPYAGSYIHLLLSNLNLQGGESIRVYDGKDHGARRLTVIDQSSRLSQPVSLRSSGSHMMVHFTTPQTRNSNRWEVFVAKYHFEDSCDFAGEMHCGAEDNKCFRLSQSCDGIWDCPLSGADEEGCYMCPTHSYSCGDYGHELSNKCYFKHDRCSGASVCPNDADELHCNEQLCSESRNLFLCANKRCILYNFICDGHDDCGDNSDEEGCSRGSSRKVIVAAVVGSLLCSLLLVLSLGCACKFYYLRHHYHRHPQHQHRGPRYDTPLSRLQAELFRRRAPPPPYHEAMLTSRPYDEAVREYLAQTQQARDLDPAEQESQDVEQADAGNNSGDPSVQNLISLMDFSEQGEGEQQNFNEHSGRLEIQISSDTSSESESEGEDDHHHHSSTLLAEDHSGQIEMTENLGRGSSHTHPGGGNEEMLPEDISEDSASATLSADGTEMTSLAEEGEGDTGKAPEETPTSREGAEESDKENNSDADSVCILCLDEDPAALDDGSDTRCLLQDL